MWTSWTDRSGERAAEQDSEEQDVKEQGIEEQDIEEQDVKEQDIKEQGIEEQGIEEQSIKEQGIEEKGIGEKHMDERKMSERKKAERGLEGILAQVRAVCPLVHCITNYVTVNDVANMVLACGGSPIMADDIAEAADITAICGATVINIGTLNSRTIASMAAAGKRANELGHPVVLDPVGAGASALRTQTALRLMQEVQFSVIRGNISEIKTLCGDSASTKGVDAAEEDQVQAETLAQAAELAKALSRQTGAVTAITGAVDIIASQDRGYFIRNGVPAMSRITGTGCMLSGVVAAWCAANQDRMLEAAAAAVAAEGLCGELAWQKVQKNQAGTSSMRTWLIDAMSMLTEEQLLAGMKIESF